MAGARDVKKITLGIVGFPSLNRCRWWGIVSIISWFTVDLLSQGSDSKRKLSLGLFLLLIGKMVVLLYNVILYN